MTTTARGSVLCVVAGMSLVLTNKLQSQCCATLTASPGRKARHDTGQGAREQFAMPSQVSEAPCVETTRWRSLTTPRPLAIKQKVRQKRRVAPRPFVQSTSSQSMCEAIQMCVAFSARLQRRMDNVDHMIGDVVKLALATVRLILAAG